MASTQTARPTTSLQLVIVNAELHRLILLQVASFGPQSFQNFYDELEEHSPADIREALLDLTRQGQLAVQPWVPEPLYFLKTQ